MPQSPGDLLGLGIVVAAAAGLGIGWLVLVAPWWVRAKRAGLEIGAKEVLGLRLRKAPVGAIIRARTAAKREQLSVDVAALETHALAGGDPEALVMAMIEARQRGEEVALEDVAALDLVGMDAVALVRAGERLTGLAGSERGFELLARFRKPPAP